LQELAEIGESLSRNVKKMAADGTRLAPAPEPSALPSGPRGQTLNLRAVVAARPKLIPGGLINHRQGK